MPLPRSHYSQKQPANKPLSGPNLLDIIVEDLHALGVVGEDTILPLLYLVMTSRILEKPLSAVVQGPTSTGKSFLVEKTAELCPPECRTDATKISPTALYHYAGSLEHKFVVGGERKHKIGPEAIDDTAALRQLLSEGRITELVTESVKGKQESQSKVTKGPIAYVETTTQTVIFDEDLNRMLLLHPTRTKEQTRLILTMKGLEAERKPDITANTAVLEKHHKFQRGLTGLPVIIPYGSRLTALMPDDDLVIRRTCGHVLNLIRAIALLHQGQRRKENGCIIATIKDYEAAKRFLNGPLGNGTVPAKAAQFYKKLTQQLLVGKEFTTKKAQEVEAYESESTVKRRLAELERAGCVKKMTEGAGTATQWQLTGKTPEQSLLPAPQLLTQPVQPVQTHSKSF